MKILSKPDLSAMEARWSSAIVARQEVERFTGGVVTSKYMSWLDSQGKGPRYSVRMGRKVAYPVKELVLWLEARSEFVVADDKNVPVSDRSNFADNNLEHAMEVTP